MNKTVLAALIVAAAILIAVAASIYFSPLQTCVRSRMELGERQPIAEQYCTLQMRS